MRCIVELGAARVALLPGHRRFQRIADAVSGLRLRMEEDRDWVQSPHDLLQP